MVKDNPTNVPIIAPLNEPARFISLDALAVIRQYWYDSWGKIRFPYGTSQQGNTVELIHDAFQSLNYWRDVLIPLIQWRSNGYAHLHSLLRLRKSNDASGAYIYRVWQTAIAFQLR